MRLCLIRWGVYWGKIEYLDVYLLRFPCRFFCCVYINRIRLIINGGSKSFSYCVDYVLCLSGLVWFVCLLLHPTVVVANRIKRRELESFYTLGLFRVSLLWLRVDPLLLEFCPFTSHIWPHWVAPLHVLGAYLENVWSWSLLATVVWTKRGHRV